MDELNWTLEPNYKRTDLEQLECNRLITNYVANHNCRYTLVGDIIETSAQPRTTNKHSFTPVERLTLDYDGRF